jgi:hypothetical protein
VGRTGETEVNDQADQEQDHRSRCVAKTRTARVCLAMKQVWLMHCCYWGSYNSQVVVIGHAPRRAAALCFFVPGSLHVQRGEWHQRCMSDLIPSSHVYSMMCLRRINFAALNFSSGNVVC